jgi:hypothetical protein
MTISGLIFSSKKSANNQPSMQNFPKQKIIGLLFRGADLAGFTIFLLSALLLP